MKHLILFLPIALLVGCNTTKNFTTATEKFLADHNFQKEVVVKPDGTLKIKASIDSLYDYSKVTQICEQADLTFKVSQGRIEIEADCTEGGEDLVALFSKLIASVQFRK